jgi:hypothetical protein
MKRYDSRMFKKGDIYSYCVHTMKTWRRSRGMAQLTLNLGSGWSSVLTSPPATLPPGKYLATIEKVAGWTLEPVWMFWRKIVPAGIRIPIHD